MRERGEHGADPAVRAPHMVLPRLQLSPLPARSAAPPMVRPALEVRHALPPPRGAAAPPPPAHAPAHVHAPAPKPHSHAHGHGHHHRHEHAPAHAHSHGTGGCSGSHGLLDAHSHDWTHLTLAPRSRRLLAWAFAIQLAFLVLEVVGGVMTNSLALLGDAAHMLADVGALALALLAARLAARPADMRRTWGTARAELLAAAVNSATLLLSCGWIAFEAVRRAIAPEHVDAHGVIGIAIAGLGANLVTAWLLARADRDNLNIRAAMAHTLVDAASSVGVILAAVVIALGGPVAIDTIASLLIAVLAVKGTMPVLRAALDGLLDTAPGHAGAADVARVLGAAPGVRSVHDVHVWEPGPRRLAASAHVLVAPHVDVGAAIAELRRDLSEQLGIDHATLQVAPDRGSARHEVERRLPRDRAVERAVALVESARPNVDLRRVRDTVWRRASHVPDGAPASPVRLAVAAMRDLDG